MKKYLFILIFLAIAGPALRGHAGNFYVDFTYDTLGVAPDGLSTSTAWTNLDSFTEVARNPGDVVWLRRGTASTTVTSAITFTSDGVAGNPIILAADYDNLWNDFSTSTQTFTVTVGSTTMAASAAITGIAAGDWIYVAGDHIEDWRNATTTGKDFAYEVRTVSADTLTLYLPYKGNQSGAGLSLRVMPDAPRWGDGVDDFDVQFATDNFWLVKGLEFQGHETGTSEDSGLVIDNSNNIEFFDFINTVTGGNVKAWIVGQGVAGITNINIIKTRVSKAVTAESTFLFATNSTGFLYIRDSLFRDTSATTANIFRSGTLNVVAYNLIFEFSNKVNILFSMTGMAATMSCKNCRFNNDFIPSSQNTNGPNAGVFFEDYNGALGDNRQYLGLSAANNEVTLSISTSTVRSGGGATSILANPSTKLSTNDSLYQMKLFEYPIYTDTTSKTYSMFFHSTSTAQWLSAPTASQLWIECEYWNFPSAFYPSTHIKKSYSIFTYYHS